MTTTDARRPLPTDITSPLTKLVYLSLTTSGGATADALQRELRISKLALYAVLDSLIARDLVRRVDGSYEAH